MTVIAVPRENALMSTGETTASYELEELWDAPAIAFGDDEHDDSEEWVMFVVAGLAFGAALAYASYCTSKGGHPNIQAGWSGFKVSCNK